AAINCTTSIISAAINCTTSIISVAINYTTSIISNDDLLFGDNNCNITEVSQVKVVKKLRSCRTLWSLRS
uniref:hypothetical protein n=1 Tax=Prevotella sp. TaxID=59823 RepID=UPI0027E2C1F7